MYRMLRSLVKMNIFYAARHEVSSPRIKQPRSGFYMPHVAKRPSKRSALVLVKMIQVLLDEHQQINSTFGQHADVKIQPEARMHTWTM